MAKVLTENVRSLVKQLIFNVSGFDESSEHYQTVEDFALVHIASHDYYTNYNRRDIEDVISKLTEKFQFHGFQMQAESLKKLTKKFFDTATSKDDLEVRSMLLKLLLDLSHSPTKKFLENPELYKPKPEVEEEITDWAAYLNNTRLQIVQHHDETSDEEWSADETDIPNKTLVKDVETVDGINIDVNLPECSVLPEFPDSDNLEKIKETLRKTIQTDWWNRKKFAAIPKSDHEEALISFKWDEFIHKETMGLIKPDTNVISEYKIIRELIWQFFVPTTCFAFEFQDGKIVPKANTTVASVRAHSFQLFLNQFVPYIEMFTTFRNFQKSLHGDYFVEAIPDTYRSYSCAVQEIMEPVIEKFLEIEICVMKQEKPFTLLDLANELRPHLKNTELLYNIHNDLKMYEKDDSFSNVTYMLSYLYFGLFNSSELTEQNFYLTLYLHSLYKYFTIIEIWLAQDLLDDSTNEFVITTKPNKLSKENLDWKMVYQVKELNRISKLDGMLQIICTKVLQLANNIHLLRLLGKLHLIDECASAKESLHEEFINKVLETTNTYTNVNGKINDLKLDLEDPCEKEPLKLSIICPDQKTSSSGMDSIENFLDMSDGFLTTVFESYLYQKSSESSKKQPTLFQRINQSLPKLIPEKHILEDTFLDVLKDRYSVPGLMVKNILINEYGLIKHFEFLKHLYLFKDDIIFPFYKKMFEKFERQEMWGNFFWLTSQLQDLLMDLHPEFYEDCRVEVEPNWRLCTNPIMACELVSVHYRIKWPISIIISEHDILKYHEVFQFILKLKWAMNTLNRLSFLEIEPKAKPFKYRRLIIQRRIRKLESLKFLLINDVSSIQHYVLGHLFNSLRNIFDKDLNDSYDLESLVNAHDKFIHRTSEFCSKLRNEKNESFGFRKILDLVLQLYDFWHNLYKLDDKNLEDCALVYQKCHKYLRPIIEMKVASLF